MIQFIALFFPAVISVFIRHKRNEALQWKSFETLIEYVLCVLWNVFITEVIIAFIFGARDSVVGNLEYYSYFVKYMAIAITMAWATPYMIEIIMKYIKIKFTVDEGTYQDEKKK